MGEATAQAPRDPDHREGAAALAARLGRPQPPAMPPPLTRQPVGRTLFGLAAPMAVGIVALMAFNVVDTFFVAQLGTDALAAISLTFPVVALVFGITMGLGIGVTAVVSQVLGAGDRSGFRRLTTDALLLGLVIVGAASAAGFATIDPVFRLLGATDTTLPLVRDYMELWYAGIVFLVIPVLGNAAIRATGDTRTPAAIMVGAALANAVLDPVLIFGLGPIPAMGIRGAALATVIGRAVILAVAIGVLVVRERAIAVDWPGIGGVLGSWGRILRVAVPAAATQMLAPLATGILTAMVAAHGAVAVAAYGAATRIEALALIAVMATSAGLAPFVGQNWGAHRPDRVAAALRLAARFSLVWGLGSVAVFSLGGDLVAAGFVDDPAVRHTLGWLLIWLPLSHGAQGVFLVVSSALNASNRAAQSAGLSAIRMLGLTVPGAVLGDRIGGLPGIIVGLTLAQLLAGLLAWGAARRLPCWGTNAARPGPPKPPAARVPTPGVGVPAA
jgi:putative MATE family efflux protein